MSKPTSNNNRSNEGYIYVTYGDIQYLKHAVASVTTLRRYDDSRAVAIYCSENHLNLLNQHGLNHLFTDVFLLPDENQSITGFKHNLYKFLPYDKNLFIDSDIVWCRDPDHLWKSLSAYSFTITGHQTADIFFGAHKGFAVIKDLVFRRRKKTLDRFGLSYLSRVQAGMIYTSDLELVKSVCELSSDYFENRELTHFRSRKEEKGRNEESCEWSLAMAMSKLSLQVFPWLNGYESPQIDFIDHYTLYDEDFQHVECLLYTNRFVYDLKGLKNLKLQSLLIRLITIIPGKGDSLYVTPYCLHFGWYHQKKPFYRFAEKYWDSVVQFKKKAAVSS